ncbi:hypothetical protein TNCV_4420811 [Trichonephila clavipes]|nr:hypothetical protein TNCV_4420811 [Trichonephila clavipes]
MVKKWVRQFNDGLTNVHDKELSGQLFVVNDGFVEKLLNIRSFLLDAVQRSAPYWMPAIEDSLCKTAVVVALEIFLLDTTGRS